MPGSPHTERHDERTASRGDGGPADLAARRVARYRERVRRAGRGQRAGARGSRHRFVLHRPARLSHAGERSGRRGRGDPRRTARLHAVGRHRRAAGRRGAGHGCAARARHPPRGRRRRRRRQALHRLHDRVGDRPRGGRRGDLPGARVPDLRVADRRQRGGPRAHLPARVAQLRLRSRGARREDRPEDPARDPQHPAQSDRRDPVFRGPRRHRRDPLPTPERLGVRRRDLLAARLRRPVRHDREATRPARAHGDLRWRVEDLGDDRLAHRLCREPRTRAGVHALDHEHRLVCVPDLAVGGARGGHRAPGRREGRCGSASSSVAT